MNKFLGLYSRGVRDKVDPFEKNFFVSFFKYEKDFRGTYNIYKLLKQCWKYTSEFL